MSVSPAELAQALIQALIIILLLPIYETLSTRGALKQDQLAHVPLLLKLGVGPFSNMDTSYTI